MSVWDDEYGISVHAKYQTTKENISEILKGLQRDEENNGYEIFRVKGWDYPALVDTYQKAAEVARAEHVPVLIHVNELTQPQGHSTSGSHERYKNAERLAWEAEFDCVAQMKKWMIENNIASEEELNDIESASKKEVLEGKKEAWANYLTAIKEDQAATVAILNQVAQSSENKVFIEKITHFFVRKNPCLHRFARPTPTSICIHEDDLILGFGLLKNLTPITFLKFNSRFLGKYHFRNAQQKVKNYVFHFLQFKLYNLERKQNKNQTIILSVNIFLTSIVIFVLTRFSATTHPHGI
jgi:hypothetical protein